MYHCVAENFNFHDGGLKNLLYWSLAHAENLSLNFIPSGPFSQKRSHIINLDLIRTNFYETLIHHVHVFCTELSIIAIHAQK